MSGLGYRNGSQYKVLVTIEWSYICLYVCPSVVIIIYIKNLFHNFYQLCNMFFFVFFFSLNNLFWTHKELCLLLLVLVSNRQIYTEDVLSSFSHLRRLWKSVFTVPIKHPKLSSFSEPPQRQKAMWPVASRQIPIFILIPFWCVLDLSKTICV